MRIHRLALTACVALAATGVLSGNASAQDYPNKPLRLIVSFPPGGGND
ncbi:MAG: tripartite tricarboxylate transporter substrate binding protein, partial [Betaproteobacteria bacterium]|nr:tripartite tricarboxylate transporter substrate binding protein [Betaproteobacteria bacterium]